MLGIEKSLRTPFMPAFPGWQVWYVKGEPAHPCHSDSVRGTEAYDLSIGSDLNLQMLV